MVGVIRKGIGRKLPKSPEELNSMRLDEITSQPLLNYLVALTYKRNNVDFSSDSNLNLIYNDLLKAVYERSWADNPHPAIGTMSEREFIRVLEAIAVSVWQNTGRTASITEIEAYCHDAGLKELLGKFQEGASLGLTKLLTAFYFRQSGGIANSERTFEFTHKSFGEYLMAKRIVNFLRSIHKQIKDREQDPDDGLDERGALKRWIDIFGKANLDEYLADFIENELKLLPIDIIKNLQNTICKLFNYCLKHGIPIDLVTPRDKFNKNLN